MNRTAWTLGICLFALLALATPAPLAQETPSAEAQQAAKEKAKEERIQEYLRKKEERRVRREAEQKLRQDEEAARMTADALAHQEAALTAPAVDSNPKPKRTKAAIQATQEPSAEVKAEPKPKKQPRRAATRSALPRQLAKIHATLREEAFAQDPTIQPYFDLIESGNASAQQIAAFGNFLGQIGRPDTALAYYDLALDLDDMDTTIWLNAGTLQRQVGNYAAAAGAYSEALGVNPNHAFAHYNLGAVLDEMGEYDEAIEEYKIALTLDPTLGDPKINPQAANNEKLIAVRMLLYKTGSGTLGLPLVTVPNGELEDKK